MQHRFYDKDKRELFAEAKISLLTMRKSSDASIDGFTDAMQQPQQVRFYRTTALIAPCFATVNHAQTSKPNSPLHPHH